MNEAQKLNLKLNPQQKLITGETACHIVGFGRTKLNELNSLNQSAFHKTLSVGI